MNHWTKRTDTLTTRDAEDLEDYAGSFRDLGQGSQSFDPKGSPTFETPSHPHGFDSFSDRSNTALARSIHRRLGEAAAFYEPAATVLVAMHSPTAVACDGKSALSKDDEERIRDAARHGQDWKARQQLDVGRRLAVYPMTWTADECRRWAELGEHRIVAERLATGVRALCGGKGKPGPREGEAMGRVARLLTLSGRRPGDLFAAIAAAKASAKGAEADLWRDMDREAQALILGAVRAWNAMATHRERRTRMRTDRLAERAA